MTAPIHFDLRARAREAMLDEGFAPDFPAGTAQQLHEIERRSGNGASEPSVRDLRGLLWSSIDNDDSRDLDQIEFAEALPDDAIRVLIGIADVDAFVPRGSTIDHHAAANTTTVYTGVATFSMLPEELSTDITSLLDDGDRLAVVVEMEIGRDGMVGSSRVYRALVRNRAKLIYEAVGAWLEGRASPPAAVEKFEGLEAQLRLQNEVSRRLRAFRQTQGILDFETIEARPVMEDGRVVDIAVPHKGPARSLIENFMIAANTTMATFLEGTGHASIQRIVRSPVRWPRIVEIAERLGYSLPPEPDSRALADFLASRKAADPARFPDLSLSIVKLIGPGEYTLVRSGEESAGHFGLAVYNYTHSTAPNRRFADLVTQRLVKAAMLGAPVPYTEEDLAEIAQRCTEREDAARKVERLMRKVAAAALFSSRIGDVFEAIVTGASVKGVYARVIAPPVEGRIVRGEESLDVGDHVRVRLIAADPERGFIDFAHVG